MGRFVECRLMRVSSWPNTRYEWQFAERQVFTCREFVEIVINMDDLRFIPWDVYSNILGPRKPMHVWLAFECHLASDVLRSAFKGPLLLATGEFDLISDNIRSYFDFVGIDTIDIDPEVVEGPL
ncbi:hypothetical protein C475_19618 [Halosimplex carlsbadense 2-9-1]|uniref:Uncharacterized protein n=1 Tax=Halosimplex carlsbadense 2-9-1 TaxID=797114 RepID=M0CC27_9EURY|nr:hypothetical protein C475_19618 [Halosimplex carlsbadense 2-9-1]